MNNEALKAVLLDEPKALFDLHEKFRFDYNKPFQAVLIEGNTTIKKMWKAVSADDFSKVVVLSHLGKWINPNSWDVAELTTDTTINIEFGFFPCPNLRTYHKKSDFKESIKDFSNAYHVVICQQEEYLTPKKTTPTIKDYKARYLLDRSSVRIDSWSLKRENIPYIDRFSVFDIESNISIHYDIYEKITDVHQIIDKSGYFVTFKRNELKRKADEIRANKAKAAFEVFDTSDKVEELSLRVEAKRLDLVAMLRNAKTADALEKVKNKLGAWRGLVTIYEEFEDMQQKVANKNYKSIEQFNNHYEHINRMLLELEGSFR